MNNNTVDIAYYECMIELTKANQQIFEACLYAECKEEYYNINNVHESSLEYELSSIQEGVVESIKNFFMKIIDAIMNFFGKLFGFVKDNDKFKPDLDLVKKAEENFKKMTSDDRNKFGVDIKDYKFSSDEESKLVSSYIDPTIDTIDSTIGKFREGAMLLYKPEFYDDLDENIKKSSESLDEQLKVFENPENVKEKKVSYNEISNYISLYKNYESSTKTVLDGLDKSNKKMKEIKSRISKLRAFSRKDRENFNNNMSRSKTVLTAASDLITKGYNYIVKVYSHKFNIYKTVVKAVANYNSSNKEA